METVAKVLQNAKQKDGPSWLEEPNMVGATTWRRQTFRYLRDAKLQRTDVRRHGPMSKAELRAMAQEATKAGNVEVKRLERKRRHDQA